MQRSLQASAFGRSRGAPSFASTASPMFGRSSVHASPGGSFTAASSGGIGAQASRFGSPSVASFASTPSSLYGSVRARGSPGGSYNAASSGRLSVHASPKGSTAASPARTGITASRGGPFTAASPFSVSAGMGVGAYVSPEGPPGSASSASTASTGHEAAAPTTSLSLQGAGGSPAGPAGLASFTPSLGLGGMGTSSAGGGSSSAAGPYAEPRQPPAIPLGHGPKRGSSLYMSTLLDAFSLHLSGSCPLPQDVEPEGGMRPN